MTVHIWLSALPTEDKGIVELQTGVYVCPPFVSNRALCIESLLCIQVIFYLDYIGTISV